MAKAVETKSIVMVGYEGAQILDIAGPLEMFAAANILHERPDEGGSPPYEISLLAKDAGPFETTGGLSLVAHESLEEFSGEVDTLMVSGGDGTLQALEDETLLDFIRQTAGRARRIVSICSGAFLLAEAGLLEGRRATTHWNAAAYFKKRYPDIELEEDAIYVRDGNVWSSAGVTSGMDLALALIALDLGADTALEVARKNVIFMLRPGGQSQFSSHLKAASGGEGPVGRAMQWIVSHLKDDLSLPQLSNIAAMSERTFLRKFKGVADMTPAKYVEAVRLETARQKLEASDHSVDVIADECGFGSSERMRRVFHRQLGVAPQQYRDRFQITALKEASS